MCLFGSCCCCYCCCCLFYFFFQFLFKMENIMFQSNHKMNQPTHKHTPNSDNCHTLSNSQTLNTNFIEKTAQTHNLTHKLNTLHTNQPKWIICNRLFILLKYNYAIFSLNIENDCMINEISK